MQNSLTSQNIPSQWHQKYVENWRQGGCRWFVPYFVDKVKKKASPNQTQIHWNKYKGWDSQVMYFCIQTYATYCSDETGNFSTVLQTILS